MNWKNLFRFTPRAGREEFAAVGLVCNLLTFGNLAVSFFLADGTLPASGAGLWQILSVPVSLLAFWVGLALYSRRLHDFNLSLWWYILYIVITTGVAFTSAAAAWAVSVLGLVVWTVLAVKKAPAQENRFGVTQPFFPQTLRAGAFWLTAALGVLVCAAITVGSQYSLSRLKSAPAVTDNYRF